jgi:hypothetical protein
VPVAAAEVAEIDVIAAWAGERKAAVEPRGGIVERRRSRKTTDGKAPNTTRRRRKLRRRPPCRIETSYEPPLTMAFHVNGDNGAPSSTSTATPRDRD